MLKFQKLIYQRKRNNLQQENLYSHCFQARVVVVSILVGVDTLSIQGSRCQTLSHVKFIWESCKTRTDLYPTGDSLGYRLWASVSVICSGWLCCGSSVVTLQDPCSRPCPASEAKVRDPLVGVTRRGNAACLREFGIYNWHEKCQINSRLRVNSM